MTFTALVLDQSESGLETTISQVEDDRLPEGDVTVAVDYSTLNYKDGMILQGVGRLVRDYPHVPGVDFSGIVENSDDERFSPGDRVVLTGWRVGEARWGGYATRARVQSDWLVKLPASISNHQAMAIGTAGFTAMQALIALERHGLQPGDPLLVTGASGGVGSAAVVWAGLAGHHVVASTGRPENADDLIALGATEVIDRSELGEVPTRPLLSERWGGCIDAVGGDTLAHVLTEMKGRGSVAACGLAGGIALTTTVIPFLLRGVNLLGIDSVMCPLEHRVEVWSRLGEILDNDPVAVTKLDSITSEVPLTQIVALAPEILAGKVKGRTVVNCRE